jgi:plastocyanin
MDTGCRRTGASPVATIMLAAAFIAAIFIGLRPPDQGASAATTLVMVGQRPDGSKSDEFNPISFAITEGDTVQWEWFDGTHDVTPFDPGDFPGTSAGHFSGLGDTYGWTFTTAGTIWYYSSSKAEPRDIDTNEDGVVDGNDSPDYGKMIGRIDVQAAASDSTGPTSSSVAASPDPTDGAGSVTLTAAIDDLVSGGSAVQAAEYFVVSAGPAGTGTAMLASDGTYDSPSEDVTATVDVSALGLGTQTLWVRGQDVAGNWGAARAGSIEVTATPVGSLSLTTSAFDFGSLSLTGIDQTVDAVAPVWQASDARGSGAGWNVTISSTDFSSVDGVIPVPNFKIRLRPEKIVPVSGNGPPTSQVLTFQPLSGSPLKILSAAPGDGMGSYEFIPDFRLTAPAETSEGSYQAILTVSISSGP